MAGHTRFVASLTHGTKCPVTPAWKMRTMDFMSALQLHERNQLRATHRREITKLTSERGAEVSWVWQV